MKLISWQTTLGGFINMVLVTFHELSFLFDDKSDTNPSFTIIFGAIATFYALWRARDNKTSDEQASAGVK